ncbi:10507_t:CDS:2 [Racocetra persica]|uniref:10507_t:CDS:1 n=1 Tax=Racocetra persica TaxID=160502 RepID=A0ACA9NMP2_9GLOM|nr:10507_t:CDS:2 [Racocetra persica]
MPHNANLVLEICGGLRPNLDTELAPEPLKDLIKRPKASELNKTLNNWQHGFDEKKGNVEFARQRKKIKIIEQCYTILLESGYHEETEEVHKMVKKLLAANNKPGYQIYPREVYHSKFIDTEKINKLLQSSKEENKEQLRYFDNFDDLGLAVSFEELDIIGNEKEKTEQQQSSLQAQIQIPPKSN